MASITESPDEHSEASDSKQQTEADGATQQASNETTSSSSASDNTSAPHPPMQSVASVSGSEASRHTAEIATSLTSMGKSHGPNSRKAARIEALRRKHEAKKLRKALAAQKLGNPHRIRKTIPKRRFPGRKVRLAPRHQSHSQRQAVCQQKQPSSRRLAHSCLLR